MEVIKELKEYTEKEFEELRNQGMYFDIRDWKVPHMYETLKPYIKKAEKYGIPYTIEEIGKLTRINHYTTIGGKKETEEVHYIIIKLEFEIKLGEWELVCAIDHTPNGNIIRKGSKRELPEKYRTVKGICEHCNSNRPRKSTVVVYSEKEGYKQIGKNCLKLYTGLDLSKVAYMNSFSDIISEYDNEDCDYSACWGHKVSTIDALDILALGWKLINTFGYVKSKQENSTIGRLWETYDYLNGEMQRYNGKHYNQYKKFLEQNNIKFFTKEDYEIADKIIEYIMTQAVSSDYMNNLHVLFSNLEKGTKTDSNGNIYNYAHCYINKKYTSMILSAVQVYIRGMNLLEEQTKESISSNHIGNVGDRVSFDIKNLSVISSWDNSFNGGYTYTTTYLYKITDTQNNIYTWKTNKFLELSSDYDYAIAPLKLTGTVKSHNEYKTTKQTELTRCHFCETEVKSNGR